MNTQHPKCHDCDRPYGDEHGFPDLLIPHDIWRQISPTGDQGGLLCPSCICKRLHDAGIRCLGAFASGPINAIPYEEMSSLMWNRTTPDEISERMEEILKEQMERPRLLPSSHGNDLPPGEHCRACGLENTWDTYGA